MPSLKSLKTRIKSVKSTQKITKAMKMVAASKLKRAREKAEAAVPYANKMHAMLAAVAAGANVSIQSPNLLNGNGFDKTHLMVVITADRGLCGAFNAQIAKEAKRAIEKAVNAGKVVKIICIGKKGYESLRKQYQSLIVEYHNFNKSKTVQYAEANQLAEQIVIKFYATEFDVCHLIYSKFKSVIAHVPTVHQILPLSMEDSVPESATIYDFEPGEEEILNVLLPQNLAVQIYRAMLETAAGEQGSRMSAMDNATRNSGEMIKKLQLVYNRTRQAFITKELIEIISGAEAV